MTDKVKNTLLVATPVTALALGGAAIAGAAGSGSSSSTQSQTEAESARGDLPPQRSDETLLTGNTASRVRPAALARVPGGTIDRVETDADGHAPYEAQSESRAEMLVSGLEIEVHRDGARTRAFDALDDVALEPAEPGRREVAGDAVDRGAVRAIGRQIDLDDRVVEAGITRVGHPDRCGCG